jgi:hypothetical protein
MQIMDPTTHLWLVEQDRERAMTQRALERAARAGGEQRPWLARGGILGFALVLRRAGASLTSFTFGGPRSTRLSGPAGI